MSSPFKSFGSIALSRSSMACQPVEDGLLGAVQSLEQAGDVARPGECRTGGPCPRSTWFCIPFRSVTALRLFLRSSRNAGVLHEVFEAAGDGIEPAALDLLRVAGGLHHLQQGLGSPAGLLQPLGPERGHRGGRVGHRAGVRLGLRSMTSRFSPGRAAGSSRSVSIGHRDPLTASDAEGGDAAPAAGVLQSGQERDQEPRAAAADRDGPGAPHRRRCSSSPAAGPVPCRRPGRPWRMPR